MTANASVDKLNRILADATVYYQKLRHFHWNVTGSDFFELHEKFEEIYNRWTVIIDDVAERIRQLGGTPLTTLKAVLAAASIKEQSDTPSAAAMVREVLADLRTQMAIWNDAITEADKAGDRPTVNLLDGVNDEAAKTMWMLQAWLGN